MTTDADLQAWIDKIRPQLVVGTVLETYDCGYIRVDELVDEGVIAPTFIDPRYLWTWKDLFRLSCIIYEQPATGADAAAEKMRWSPTVERRGGRVEISPPASSSRSELPAVVLDAAVVRSLVRLLSPACQEAELVAGSPDATSECTITELDSGSSKSADEELRHHLSKLQKFTSDTQGGRGWSQLTCRLTREAPQQWRYDLNFEY